MVNAREQSGFAVLRGRGSLRAFVVALMGVLPGSAPGIELHMPMACDLGNDCFVLQVPDRVAGPGYGDFSCGSLSYDGHNGTDIALPSLKAMARGVNVIASAPGRVRAIRDEMPDRLLDDEGRNSIAGRECGNGVVLVHSDGWETQYCHLKRGSVAVRVGDTVERGAVLGQVGLSGLTEFPHLHLVLRRDGTVIDPFDGRPVSDACLQDGSGMSHWFPSAGLDDVASDALSSGNYHAVPSYKQVWAEAPHLNSATGDTPALVHWGHFFGLRQGDRISTMLLAPGGEVLAQAEHIMTRNRATEFRAVGIRRPAAGWAAGTYRGVSTLLRGEEVIAKAERSTVLDR